jgi:YD repeat-containing protein
MNTAAAEMSCGQRSSSTNKTKHSNNMKMKLKQPLTSISAILCLALLLPQQSIAQDGIKSDVLQNIIPPSPTAASLAKYGEIPVGLYNGIPEISVPIYQLSAGKIALPISISYHAAGIRVEEIASPVGIGWSLNAGGAIVRQTRHLPDESPYGFLYKNQQVAQYINNQMTQLQQQTFFQEVTGGYCDTEPDIFFYNIGGQSGKFYFDAAGNAVTIPKSKLKFTFSGNSWLMTDNSGIEYTFSQPEQTTSVGSTLSAGTVSNPDPHTSISSWFISKISVPGTNNEVLFEYDNFVNSYYTLAPQTKYASYSVNTGCGDNPPVGPGELLSNTISSKRLKKITGLHETIDFVYSPLLRLDQETDKALERIVVKNNASQVIKENLFTYAGLANQPPGMQPGLAMYSNRLVLLSSKTVNGSNENGGTYTFTYNPGQLPGRLSYSQDLWGFHNGAYNPTWLVPTTSVSAPNGLTLNIIGANRLVNENFAKYALLEKINYPTGGSTYFNYEANKIGSYDYSPDDNSLTGSASVGSQINGGNIFESPVFAIVDCNPTDNVSTVMCTSTVNNSGCGGGLANLECPMASIVGVDNNASIPMNASTYIYLSPGQYKLVLDLSGVDPASPVFSSAYAQITYPRCPQQSIYGAFQLTMGGLRVKKIINQDINGATIGEKFYSYNFPGTTTSSGSVSRLPEYTSEIESLKSLSLNWGGTAWFNCKYMGVSSTSNYPLSNTKGGTVGYSYVKVTNEQNGAQGYTESWFTSPASHPDVVVTGFPFAPATDYDWQRGFLTREASFTATGPNGAGGYNYQKVQQKEISYGTMFPATYFGLKTGQRFFTPLGCSSDMCQETIKYDLASGSFLPVQEVNKLYQPNGDSVVTQSTMTYNNLNYQLAERKTYNSRNEELTTQVKYPLDYSGNTALNLLAADNRVNEVVEQVTINTTLQKELSRQKVEYGTNTAGAITYADVAKIQRSISGGALEDEVTVQLRDNNRNILQAVGKDGITVTYIYGYNGTLPVAKVAGATYSTVSTLINLTAIQTLDGAALRTALAPLRGISNAIASTYTYARGIGMTSETDPTGKTIFYEYDAFNRLSLMRDKDNNIIKRVCYNYAGQPEDCPL